MTAGKLDDTHGRAPERSRTWALWTVIVSLIGLVMAFTCS